VSNEVTGTPVAAGPAGAVVAAAASVAAAPQRKPARIGILSPGTSVFDSRAHRIARSLVAQGDSVTIYSRHKQGALAEEWIDGYHIVRIPLSDSDVDAARAEAKRARRTVGGAGARKAGPTDAGVPTGAGSAAAAGSTAKPAARRGPIGRRLPAIGRTLRKVRRELRDQTDRIPAIRRFRAFPRRPISWAGWFERQVEPHDIWHGMWAGSLPALPRVARRHGGATVYDARDVYLRSLQFGNMPRWERALITPFERRWAHEVGAVVQVSDQYAAMMRRDLGLTDVPVVRNCPDRFEPPTPRPERIRQLLDLPATTTIVLYQGGLLDDRGLEQSMDAILAVPDAVLVLMGFGSQEERFRKVAASARYAGKVFVIDAVSPQELLMWSASSDIMIMCYPPDTENHRYVTPQKLWEAMAAGVPVVASDMPGFASVVNEVDCGVLCDPASPAAITRAIQGLIDGGPEALRAMGERGRAAAHDRYNWEAQFQVLDEVYTRLLAAR